LIENIVWLRSDLRVRDNPALSSAMAQGPTACVFLLATQTWSQHHWSRHKSAFLLRVLASLADQLAKLGVPLQVLEAPHFDDAAGHLLQFSLELGAKKLYYNREYPLDEKIRDEGVHHALEKNGIECQPHDSFLVFRPNSILKDDGNPYSVFTPFKRKWLAKAEGENLRSLPCPPPQQAVFLDNKIPKEILSTEASFGQNLFPGNHEHADDLLETFLRRKVNRYHDERDFPATDGTSKLSPYLALGVISPRECLEKTQAIRQANSISSNEGIETWVSELIWRDFYTHVLAQNPRISRGKAFKGETDKMEWNVNEEWFDRWAKGETGFPIVDAGMRQLNTTGWMHNRLRMITSQFLTKHLFIDWRQGEKYFLSHLVDGEFAANNGGWQWSASTGTDAVPYFRMFNPLRQSERFDPDGNFIRENIPELTNANPKFFANPYAQNDLFSSYPSPMIDLKEERERTLKRWKQFNQTLS